MDLWIGPAILAAVISGIVGLFSLFIGGRIPLWQDRARRKEKITDYMVALRAEIRSELHNLASYDLDAHLEEIKANYAASPDYSVRASHPSRHIVFETLSKEIHLLPEEVIDPVILYGRQRYAIEKFVEELRAPDFKLLSTERQIQMYGDYIAMQRYLLTLSENAVLCLDRELGSKTPINIQAAVRSDRKSGGAA